MPVAAGVLVTLAALFLSMSFVAAIGLWRFRPEEVSQLGSDFWFAATVAWIGSAFAGSFVAAYASRSDKVSDSILNSLIAWSASYLLFGGIVVSRVNSQIIENFWPGLFGDVLSLMASVGAGIWAFSISRAMNDLDITIAASQPGRFRKKAQEMNAVISHDADSFDQTAHFVKSSLF